MVHLGHEDWEASGALVEVSAGSMVEDMVTLKEPLRRHGDVMVCPRLGIRGRRVPWSLGSGTSYDVGGRRGRGPKAATSARARAKTVGGTRAHGMVYLPYTSSRCL